MMEKKIFPIQELSFFMSILNRLVQPTRGDEKRLDEVEAALKGLISQHQELVNQFFKDNNLSDTEEIDVAHPLFQRFNEFYAEEVKSPEFPEFTAKQLATVTNGVILTRGEKKMLEYWLLNN